jgi:hypothetical protein
MAAKATAAKRGRPDGLTQEVQKRIADALRVGATAEDAARAAGVSRSTYHRWLARGEAKDAPARFRRFADEVRAAESDAKLAAITAVRRAMPDDWRAALAYLERRWPEEWARTTRHQHSGPDGEPVAVDVGGGLDTSKLTMKELEALQKLMEKAASRA